MQLFDMNRVHVGVTELMLDEAFTDWVIEQPDENLIGLTTAEIFRLYQRGTA